MLAAKSPWALRLQQVIAMGSGAARRRSYPFQLASRHLVLRTQR
jgi:hypothetical protein